MTGEKNEKALYIGYADSNNDENAVIPAAGLGKVLKLYERPVNWLKEMGSRYLFIVLYVWLEKLLTRADYRRPAGEGFKPWPTRPGG